MGNRRPYRPGQLAKLALAHGLSVIALANPLFAAETAGRVVGVEGKVLLRNSDTEKPETRILKVGDVVEKGSTLNTSSAATVKLLMTDKTILDIGASTLFKVDDYQLKGGSDRVVQMSMDYGKVRASVNRPVSGAGKFNIRTKSATMGVRGTEFIIQAAIAESHEKKPELKERGLAGSQGKEPNKNHASETQLTVIHGKVAVQTESSAGRPNQEIAVTGGNQLTTSTAALGSGVKNDPPKLVQLSSEQLTSVKQDAKQVDKTFVNAVVVLPNKDGGTSQSGAATLAAVSQSISVNPSPIQVGVPLGLPGTFGADFGLKGPFHGAEHPLVNVRVVFKK